jgi:hypothetical protein
MALSSPILRQTSEVLNVDGRPGTPYRQDANEADLEEELTDVDDDGKAQRKITNFFRKETQEETLVRIRREAEQDALTREQRQHDAERDKQLKLDKKREDARLRQQKFRDKTKAIKISEGWTPYQNRVENKVKIYSCPVESSLPQDRNVN